MAREVVAHTAATMTRLRGGRRQGRGCDPSATCRGRRTCAWGRMVEGRSRGVAAVKGWCGQLMSFGFWFMPAADLGAAAGPMGVVTTSMN